MRAWATVNASLCLMGCRYVRRDVRYSTEALPDAFASLEPAASTRPAVVSDVSIPLTSLSCPFQSVPHYLYVLCKVMVNFIAKQHI